MNSREAKYQMFLDYFKAQVDPNDPLPLRVPVYSFTDDEIPGEVIHWVQQYLIQMNCPPSLMVPLVNDVLQETRNSCKKLPKLCGFDGYAFNPLKLSTMVISHANAMCESLLDNARLNEVITRNSADVLSQIPQYYVRAIKNNRRKMEDRHTCIGDFNGMFKTNDYEPTSYYGVFDGHGGHDAAIYSAAHLCYNIAKSSKYPINIPGAIKEAFKKTDDCFIHKSEKHVLLSGTTAIVCIYRAIEKRLFVGWVGDSQALLVCEGKVCQIVAPHIPSVESERIRIEKNGGVVINWNGSYRVNGVLAVSRAIGDASYKPYVSSDPDTACISLNDREDFLIIASDGLWESLTEDVIALTVYRQIIENEGCADSVADALIEQAKKGTSDNITVVIVFFKDPKLIAKSSWLSEMEATCDKSNTNSAFENEIKLSTAIARDYPESHVDLIENDSHIKNDLDKNNQFDDDLGPETDVDGQDDVNSTESSTKLESNIICDNALNTPLENKIIQHFSEQNKDFLINSNPFKSDTLEEYHEKIPDGSIDRHSGITEKEIDNKIMDALESLGIVKEEKADYQVESVTQDLIGSSADTFGLLEKLDCYDEKQSIVLESETPDEQKNNHFMNIYEINNDQEESQDQTDYPHLSTATGESCIGEESEEDEDEWNYIKGDKQSFEHLEDTAKEQSYDTNRDCEQLPKGLYETSKTELDSGLQQEPNSSSNRVIDMNEENNLFVENKQDIESRENQKTSLQNSEDLLAQESVESKEVEQQIDLATSQNFNCEEQDQRNEQPVSSLNFATKPLTNILVNTEEIVVLATEQHMTTKETQPEIEIDEKNERPDSLVFEMASKLNPEAKEFVPISSPSLSDPASPVAHIVPSALQNPYLILSNDVVIAQSPKKDITTMENIDIPAEDDFQHEMNNRPHEFEHATEYINGNGKAIRSHSPELSYQEINLKEAMQGDEKLDGEYSDEKQTLPEENTSEASLEKNLLVTFCNELDAMNTSFYEGRDEPMLTTSSDELNKVHVLPDEDHSEQTNVDELKVSCSMENKTNMMQKPTTNEFKTKENENMNSDDKRIDSPNNIFVVASQVVNDVTALVDQMQVDASTNRLECDVQTHAILDPSNQMILTQNLDNHPAVNDNEDGRSILINLDSQQTNRQHENVPETDCASESVNADFIGINVITTTTTTNLFQIPEVDSQPKFNIENENIDNSVLQVMTPTLQDIESPAAQDGVLCKSLDKQFSEEFLKLETSFTEEETLKNTVLDNMADRITTPVSIAGLPPPEIDSNLNQLKLPIIENPSDAIEVSTSTTKIATEKLSPTVSAPINTNKKGLTVTSKLNTKPIKSTTKPAISAVKKTAASSLQTSATVSSKQPVTVSKASTASATRSSVTNKVIAEKKATIGLTKKPSSVVTNNGELKNNTISNRKVSTTTMKSVPTRGTTSGIVNTRPASTATKTTAAPKSNASTTRLTSSSPLKTNAVSSLPSVKPRTTMSRTTGKISTTTSTAAVSSRTSVTENVTGNLTKKNSSVQGTTQKSSVINKTSTTVPKMTSATYRASVTSKAVSTTVGGQRKSNATLNKKLISPPTLKTSSSKGASTNKTTHSSKIASENCRELKPPESDTQNLSDFDKQQKNDCNQLITKNGIDSQMIVIDSAAD